MKKMKIINKIFMILIFTGLLVIIASRWIKIGAMLYVGIGICLVGLIVYGVFYRCPYCRHFLGRNDGEYCAKCGKYIGSEDER